MKCPECDGQGWYTGHDPLCDGGRKCEQLCPIQVRCDSCQWTGNLERFRNAEELTAYVTGSIFDPDPPF